jgi:hypothetical protein
MYSGSSHVLQSSKVHNARHRRASPCRVHAATGTYTNTPRPTRWCTSVSPTTRPCACSAAAPGRTSSAKSEKASRTTQSRASSSAVLRTSRTGSCATRPPAEDAAASSSRATSCGTRRSSPPCRASHTTPFPSASVAPMSSSRARHLHPGRLPRAQHLPLLRLQRRLQRPACAARREKMRASPLPRIGTTPQPK